MSADPKAFEAGRPRLSGPIRRLARPLGRWALPLSGRRWLPLYVILRHTGRRSGRAYATPVVAFRTPDGFLIPLPFGDETQWARNLFAAGEAELRRAGVDHPIVEPRVVDGPAAAPHMPPLLRFLATRLGLRQFVLVRIPPATLGHRIRGTVDHVSHM